MKSAVRLAGALFLVLVASTVCANAQQGILTAHIPFDFTFGNAPMPAGEYRITFLRSAVELKTTGHTERVLSFEGNAESGPGKLVFDHYGNQYFLHEVSCPNCASLARTVAPSKGEKEARQRAIEMKLPNSGEQTTVAAR